MVTFVNYTKRFIKFTPGDKKEIFKDNFRYSSYLLGGSYSLKLNRFQRGSLFAGVGVVIT